jgi:hypothetical protein
LPNTACAVPTCRRVGADFDAAFAVELSRRSTAAGFCEAFAKYFAGGLPRDTGRRNQTVARVLGQNWRLGGGNVDSGVRLPAG